MSTFKDLKLKKPIIEYEITELHDVFEISLKSKNLVKNIFVDIDSENNFSDNYFDMIPGKKYVISIKKDTNLNLVDIKKNIKLLSLYDTY
jgi:beta-mannosidase